MQAVASLDIDEGILYPSSDGKPLGETPRHIRNMFFSFYPLNEWFAGDDDVLVAANMFVYFVRGKPGKHVSPDLFVVKGVPKERVPERRRYLVWREGKGPSVVFEFISKSTVAKDRGPKKELYRDVLKVQEYFLFDPWDEYLSPQLLGYRLVDGDFHAIDMRDGRMPSEILGLLLEADGEMLRFVDPKSGKRLPIPPELEAARQQAEVARRSQIKSRRRADAKLAQAEADIERLRRENEELRKRLAKNGGRA